ncbi:unnamed protein product [Menidia menidia]|uniref:(Atlantic silverside) hypothetical protein n=1 Tax=Menidia menidia TaxID=238744 RepID=A0A8S4AMG4_9TELE|nr:unnamed protein product [Menidia menidia]
MTDVEATFVDFIASQRSGRRNAVHEIPSAPDAQGPTDLAQGLGKLSINKSGFRVESFTGTKLTVTPSPFLSPPGDGEEDGEKKQDSAAEEEASQAKGS